MKATRIIRGALVAMAGAALFSVVPARANVILAVNTVLAAPGSTGNTLEVTLQNTGPSSITLAAFDFVISTTDTDITFTGTDITTTQPYAFAGDSFLGPVINTLGPGQTMDGFDLAASGGDAIAAGATVGLGRVFFDVIPGAATGPFAVVFSPPPVTNLSDDHAVNIPIDRLDSGQINVGEVATPEPASVTLLCMALLGMVGLRKRVIGRG